MRLQIHYRAYPSGVAQTEPASSAEGRFEKKVSEKPARAPGRGKFTGDRTTGGWLGRLSTGVKSPIQIQIQIQIQIRLIGKFVMRLQVHTADSRSQHRQMQQQSGVRTGLRGSVGHGPSRQEEKHKEPQTETACCDRKAPTEGRKDQPRAGKPSRGLRIPFA